MSMPTSDLYNLSLPRTEPHALDQDAAYFLLSEGSRQLRIRFHDYAAIYRHPGLYEQLFYQRLQCCSPAKARDVLLKVLADNQASIHERRVLDLGAGNGMVGELLEAARVIGVDITPEAKLACERDRPHAYDAYYIADLSAPDEATRTELELWNVDCLTCIAALGFSDIPVAAFANAFNLVSDGGWIVFNIKETFLAEGDHSGFARLIKHLMFTGSLHVHHLERYRHRISIDGRPLHYFLLVGRKQQGIEPGVIDACSG